MADGVDAITHLKLKRIRMGARAQRFYQRIGWLIPQRPRRAINTQLPIQAGTQTRAGLGLPLRDRVGEYRALGVSGL